MENEVSVQLTDLDTIQSFFYAGDMKFIYFLILLMFIDIVTGLAKAIKNGNLWSKKSMYGIGRKSMIFCIIILANVIDQIMSLQNGLLMMSVFYYIAHEGLSIIENCAEMDVLVPEQIKDKLKVMEDKNKKEE